ncbi:Hypothetical predicted protein [Mytilus galloprovincialis]|nr:Hypothetical predicted protein [Mytilus galloprovincialis]
MENAITDIRELEGSTVINEYTIKCGRCLNSLSVPCDRKPVKRIEYFKSKHFDQSCIHKSAKNDKKLIRDKDVQGMKTVMKSWLQATSENTAQEADEDIDNIDNQPYDVVESFEPSVMRFGDYDSDLEVDTFDIPETESDNESVLELQSPDDHTTDSETDIDPEYLVFPVVVKPANEMCIRLNELIENGKITPNTILYKYLNDVTSVLVDPNHHYDSEVIEFFNTIKYLGGERTVNFLRGPMWHGTGTGGLKNPDDAKLNFGGPSSHARLKRSSGYTTESGVIKPWLISMLQLATNDSKVVPLVESSTVKVIGLTMANDGTALKPSILYDEHQKVNVGLKDTASLDFVRKNSNPDPDFLRQNVVTDAADITYISTIDNNISLPVAVTYKPKSGKTGEDIKSQFLYEVCIVQTCLRCLQQATSMRHILHKDSVSNCNSSCSECTEQGKLCDACKNENHLSHIPSIRACNRCIENGVQCKRGAVLVITADCEQGNKTAFELLISDREAGILESKYIFAVLPDAVHVGKSLKASFANWPILLDTQRSCLPLVHTVRDAHAELKRGYQFILHLTKSSVLESVHGIVHTINTKSSNK